MIWFVLWILFLTAGFAGIAYCINQCERGDEMKDEIKNKAIDLVKEAYAQGWDDGAKAFEVHDEMSRQERSCNSCRFEPIPFNEEPCLDCCNNYGNKWRAKKETE